MDVTHLHDVTTKVSCSVGFSLGMKLKQGSHSNTDIDERRLSVVSSQVMIKFHNYLQLLIILLRKFMYSHIKKF